MQNYTRDAPSHLVNICRHFRQCENDRYRKGVVSKDSSHIGFIPFRPQTVQQIQCSNFTEQIYSVWGCAVFTTIICMSICYIELIGLKFGVEAVNFELNKFLDFSSPYVLEIIYTKSGQKKHNVDKMFPPPPPSPSPLPLLLFLRGISFAAVLENASF